MFEIRNLTKTYKGAKKPAIKNLNLTVKSGEIFGFLGANGAGKSTTIKCISGILGSDQGNIELDGIDSKTNPIAFKKLLGYVPDMSNAFERVTGYDYVWHTARLYDTIHNLDKKIMELAKKFNLEHAIKRQIKTYSHGMKQKLNMMAALIHSPRLWLLDEPMTGLDPQSTSDLIAFMREYVKDGKNSLMFSSHILNIVENLCDRVAIIHEGELRAIYDMNDLMKHKNLGEAYMSVVNNEEQLCGQEPN